MGVELVGNPESRWFITPVIALSRRGDSWLCAYCDEHIKWDHEEIVLPSEYEELVITHAVIHPNNNDAALMMTSGQLLRIKRIEDEFTFQLHKPIDSPLITMTYVEEAIHGIDQWGAVWSFDADAELAERIAPGGDRVTCQSTTSHASETVVQRTTTDKSENLEIINVMTGQSTQIKGTEQESSCGALALASEKRITARIPNGYHPIQIFNPDGSVFNIPNTLYSLSGLQRPLRHPILTSDGQRLLVSALPDRFALFDVEARRLIGAFEIQDIRMITLSESNAWAMTVDPKAVMLWNVDVDQWQMIADAMIWRLSRGG